MYHDLRKALGDEKFFKFLRQYYLKNVERTATRRDLEQALADIDPNAVPLLKLWLDTPNFVPSLFPIVQKLFQHDHRFSTSYCFLGSKDHLIPRRHSAYYSQLNRKSNRVPCPRRDG